MPYGFVEDVAANWESYEQVAEALFDPTPSGLLVHIAGPTEEGVRTIEIWQSEQARLRFEAERLAPAIAALGGPARPQRSYRTLHPKHVVVADRRDLTEPHPKGEQ